MKEIWTDEEMKHNCDLMMAHLARVIDFGWEMRQHFSSRFGLTIQSECDTLIQIINNIKNGKTSRGIEKRKDTTQADTFVCRKLYFSIGSTVLLHELNKAFIDEYGEEMYFSLGKSSLAVAVARYFPTIGPAKTIHYKGAKVRAFVNAALVKDMVKVPKETIKIDMPWYDA